MNDPVVQVQHFHKAYGNFVAVEDASFDVYRGEIFALLGPNGAGKTTTLESLEGLRQPDRGQLRVLGMDPVRDAHLLRNQIGVQLQASGMPGSITVREAMNFFCAYHQVAPRFDLLKRLELDEKLNTQYDTLSTGQKRRLALALAIAHRPAVVFLDEPTAGLDVISRTELHALIEELQQQGTTIILSSHDMAEVEKLAHRVAILLHGRIAASGTPNELTSTGAGYTKISIHTEPPMQVDDFTFPGVCQHTLKDEYDVYYSTDPAASVYAILEYIKAQHDQLIDLRVERPSLEERFLEITNHREAVR
ncbi:MAG TPA: ABC transporter ATP-binding protein [Phototrophicaceae bacterium]|nr:ABC transporter ATP-binding protein [Phototrophicaceae bacterium]